jgi:hypothetical protein
MAGRIGLAVLGVGIVSFGAARYFASIDPQSSEGKLLQGVAWVATVVGGTTALPALIAFLRGKPG